MLIDIPRIPPEGLDLDEALEASSLHLEGEKDLVLRPGGSLRGRVEIVDKGTVHVRGRLEGTVEIECSRCLEPYPVALGQELDLFYLPRVAGQDDAQEEEVELTDRDVVVGYHDGGQLDLGEVVREQVILSLPLKRLCRDECRGLCPTCGKNLNAGDCGCPPPEPAEDPRLAPLKKLFDKD
jgi:uncharacterized protein